MSFEGFSEQPTADLSYYSEVRGFEVYSRLADCALDISTTMAIAKLCAFKDSGAPEGSTDYTTVVVLHGFVWHGGKSLSHPCDVVSLVPIMLER